MELLKRWCCNVYLVVAHSKYFSASVSYTWVSCLDRVPQFRSEAQICKFRDTELEYVAMYSKRLAATCKPYFFEFGK